MYRRSFLVVIATVLAGCSQSSDDTPTPRVITRTVFRTRATADTPGATATAPSEPTPGVGPTTHPRTELVAELSAAKIAPGEIITISGHAIDPGDRLLVYVIDPDGSIGGTRVPIRDDTTFEATFDTDFSGTAADLEGDGTPVTTDTQGTYIVVILARGRDGRFAIRPDLVPDRVVSSELSQADQRDRVMEAFTGLGQDDVIVQLSFLVTDG